MTVAQNAQAAAADPRGNAFKTVLTRQEIENLSDDPTEMAQQLQDLAGGNATIRVDSFAGAPLPPKALIKSIHIVRDAFAAENHSAESEGIDIITQPGQGALSGGVNSRLRDGSLSARSPFVVEKGPERQEQLRGQRRRNADQGKELVRAVGRGPQRLRHAGRLRRAAQRRAAIRSCSRCSIRPTTGRSTASLTTR